jgi:hypothetical protein
MHNDPGHNMLYMYPRLIYIFIFMRLYYIYITLHTNIFTHYITNIYT